MSTAKDGMDADSQPQEPKETPMPSPETSASNSHFGSVEIDYLTRIEAAMQNPAQPSTVKMWLTEAQERGLDPQRLYEEAAVSARPPHWTKASPFSAVKPHHPTTPARGKLLSAAELDASAESFVRLLDGPVVLRAALSRIQAQGLDARRLYLNEVEIRQQIMQENFRPILNLPTWDEVNPDTHPAP